jgi:hypothetical protein
VQPNRTDAEKVADLLNKLLQPKTETAAAAAQGKDEEDEAKAATVAASASNSNDGLPIERPIAGRMEFIVLTMEPQGSVEHDSGALERDDPSRQKGAGKSSRG